MNETPPWEVQPALTLDRLRVITDIIVRVRREVADSMDYEEGDGFFGLWVPGTRVHARLAHHLKRIVASGQHTWLTLVDEGMQFTFAIEKIPIRIYRGDAEKPSRGAQKVSRLEYAKQLEMFDLGLITKPDLEWVWRMAVGTDPDGKAFSVDMLQIGPGRPVSVRHRYPIPLVATVPAIAEVRTFTPEGVPLESAPVEAVEHREEGEATDAADSLTGAGTKSE